MPSKLKPSRSARARLRLVAQDELGHRLRVAFLGQNQPELVVDNQLEHAPHSIDSGALPAVPKGDRSRGNRGGEVALGPRRRRPALTIDAYAMLRLGHSNQKRRALFVNNAVATWVPARGYCLTT